jgi:adenine C2-methylase RlmN of 23S rRNA A2503 and tRNA A37
MTILLKTYKRLETNQYLKLVKFIKHYSQTKPLSPEQLKRWKEEEQKIIRNFLKTMDTDLDYLTQMKDTDGKDQEVIRK